MNANRPPFRWPETTDAPDHAEAKKDQAANDFRQAIRNILQIANVAAEFTVATTDRAYVNCDLVVDPRGDQNLQNAIVKLYAITADVRVLVQTATLASVLIPQRICSVQGRGVTRWEATVTPTGLGPGNPFKTSWVLVTYGTSGGSSIQYLPTTVGAAYSFLQTDPTGAFGVWQTNPLVGSGDYIGLQATPVAVFPTSGYIRLPDQGNVLVPIITGRSGATTENILSVNTTLGQIQVGDASTIGNVIFAAATNVIARTATHYLQNAAGSVDLQEVDTTAIHAVVPVGGSSISSKAFAFAEATIAMADANQTPSATVYQCPHLILTGALTANRDLVLPATVGAFFIIDNQCTGAFSVNVKTSSGAGVLLTNSKLAQFKLNSAHTDYKKITAEI